MSRSHQRAYLAAMKRGGIVHPDITLQEAARAGITLSLACALLGQESAGGRNVWGGDNAPNGGTSGLRWKTVTENRYKQYKRARGPKGEGGRQGAGPCQLTWHTFQDRADELGGCWNPECNMRVGFTDLKAMIDRHGLAEGLEHYNTGSTTTAKGAAYSRSVRLKAERWHDILVEAAREADDPEPDAPEPDTGEPHPELSIGEKGPKVEKLERALHRRAKARDLPTVKLNGVYDRDTHGLAVEVVYRLGLYSRRIRGGVLTPYAHERIIAPHRRNATQLEREKQRAKEAEQSGTRRPRIVRAPFTTRKVFGSLGAETRFTVHYSAGGRARDLGEGIEDAKLSHRLHASKGWGGCSYHFVIPDSGELILCRPVDEKGAGVANTNSNNVHAQFPGTTGDRPTEAQKRTIRWLVANAHTEALPASHRTSRDLRRADIRGHNRWPGQSTGCPGHFTPENLGLRR